MNSGVCKDTDAALRQSKINRDLVDDAEQKELAGTLILNVPDKNMKKELRVDDERA